MEQAWKRRHIKRYNPNSNKNKFKVAVVLIIIVILSLLFDARVRPYIRSLAETTSESIAIQAINEAVESVLISENIQYDDLAIVEKNSNGQITTIKSDTVKTNILKSKINTEIQNKISQTDDKKIKIPLGSILGKEYLAGSGPFINVDVTMTGVANSKITNAFESAGINQTVHKVMLDITTKIYVILPNNTAYSTVDTNMCIAQTVIVGTVPDMMAQINPNVAQQK